MSGGLDQTPSADLLLLAIGAITGLSTLAGGLIALALRTRINLILGFSAGAVLGVSLLELLPEALRTGGADHVGVSLCVGVGFILALLVDRLPESAGDGEPERRRHFGPASLTAHSLLDGLAIGVAFQASEPLGFVVAGAVIAHDLSDGANTVNLGLLGGDSRFAFRWLAADAAAPVIGIAASRLAHIPDGALSPLLAIFAGSFLYIGAGKLISESYRRHPHLWTSVASAVGFGAVYLLVRVSPG